MFTSIDLARTLVADRRTELRRAGRAGRRGRATPPRRLARRAAFPPAAA